MTHKLLAFAAAALLSGMSVAAAQGTMNKSNNLVATGSAFCSQVKGSNALDCKFATRADCQREVQATGDSCINNPRAGTTGSGMNQKMKK